MNEDYIHLDSRLLYMEDTFQQLNRIVMEQDRKIDKLTSTVRELNRKVRELEEKNREEGALPQEERPPHY